MKTTTLIILLGLVALEPSPAQTSGSRLLKVDYAGLVAKADLDYTTPVGRSEEGMPIGNGRMGSLIWTTPTALHFQINRVDVFAMGNNTRSFPKGHTDYSSGCGYVDIHVVDYGDDVFAGKKFNQHLSVYEGLASVSGDGVTARSLAWNDGEVLATELTDQRSKPAAISVDLRMLRYAVDYMAATNFALASRHASQIRTGNHSATSRLDIRDGRILLIQEFREGTFYGALAVAISVVGRKSRADYYNESTVQLTAEAGRGKFTILTASVASYDPKADVGALALKQLAAAQAKSFNEMLADNRKWWGNFWTEGFIHLHSADGVADEVEKNYTYFLYLMASCSRGEYMPRFCGILWGTDGDLRMWGSQYWWNNQGTYYNGFTPANRPELMKPVFDTYSRIYDSLARAVRQQWGSDGVWIPETCWFDGLEDLPENVAADMRDLYLARKPWSERSQAFIDYAEGKNGLNSRWNWRFLSGGRQPPFAWTSHIFSTTAKISYLYWLQYAYSLDADWLRTSAYPMIKGTAELYRNSSNLYKTNDGTYHLRYLNNLESNWGGSDAPEELLAMNAMLPIAIRASDILKVDADLRPKWQEILDHLTPIPNGALEPASYYDYCHVGADDQALFDRTLAGFNRRTANSASNGVRVLSREAVVAANLGLADKVKQLIPAQIRSLKSDNCDVPGSGETGLGVLRNRLMLREGPGAIEFERLGVVANALQNALLLSAPPTPAKEAINQIFPAWPKDWDAQYTLAARDAFVISASIQQGRVEFVEIQSRKGGPCRVQNPWPDTEVTVHRNGKAAESVSGKLLVIPTTAGETLALAPKGKAPVEKKIGKP